MISHDTIIPYRYSELRSVQGIQIVIAYWPEAIQIDNDTTYRAMGMHFTIEGYRNVLTAHSEVRLVLINQRRLNGFKLDETVYHVPLCHVETIDHLSRFAAAMNETVVINRRPASGDIVRYVPQIAVVIDGVWQIDPLQGGPDWAEHNFNFNWKPPVRYIGAGGFGEPLW